jgi:hypothetical protein
MKAKLHFHENDKKKDKTIDGLSVVFRKDDILVVGGRFYKIEDAQYDPEQKEATYWLEIGYDEHPTAPNSGSAP